MAKRSGAKAVPQSFKKQLFAPAFFFHYFHNGRSGYLIPDLTQISIFFEQ
jgi:hypothetical protein